MRRFDVAIVGAGPAGCRAARQLARGGARVALVDGSHPREKPCGGGVTGRALRLVGLTGSAARGDAVTIESAAFEHRSRAVRIDIRGTAGSPARLEVMSRRAFDAHLLHDARRAGAVLVSSRAVDVVDDASAWTVATREGSVSADWLIGADGPNSLVRRRVAAPFARRDLSVAAGYFVHGATSREATVGFVDEPAGYLWSFPRPDHLAVGVCAQADVAAPAALQAIARSWIARNVGAADAALERYSWPIPSLSAAAFDRERPAGGRWLLLGDAAGMVDPITREGIFFALLSGDAAAASLLDGGDAAQRYACRVRDEIYDELRRAARLKERFFQPHFLSLLITALERSAKIRAVMSDLIAGEQPYRGLRRRLLRTFELGLMWELLYRGGGDKPRPYGMT